MNGAERKGGKRAGSCQSELCQMDGRSLRHTGSTKGVVGEPGVTCHMSHAFTRAVTVSCFTVVCCLDEPWSTFTPGKTSRMQQRHFTQNHRIMFVLSLLKKKKKFSCNLISSYQTRYCVKWRSSQGKLVLKITDNATVSF